MSPAKKKSAADTGKADDPCKEAPCKAALDAFDEAKVAFQEAKDAVDELQTQAASLSRQGQREQHHLALAQRELNHARMVCQGARARVVKAYAAVEEACDEDCVPKHPTDKELRCP
jgi:hypothetical protein